MGSASNSNYFIAEGDSQFNYNNNFELGQDFYCHLSSDSDGSRQGDSLCRREASSSDSKTFESSPNNSLFMEEDGSSLKPCLSEDLVDDLYKTYSKSKFKIDDEMREYKCAVCPKSYKSDSSLRRHWQDTHTGPQSWICMFCNKNFKS